MHQKLCSSPECSLGSRMAMLTQLFFLGRRRCRALAFSLFSVFCSSACSGGFLFGSLVFWVLLVAGRLSPPPGEGVEFVLCGLLFLVLAVEERVLLGLPSLLALFSGSPWTSSIFSQFLYFGRFRGIFHVAGCSPGGEIRGMYFRHLPQVVFHPGGWPRSFSGVRSSRSRRLLRGEAYADCADQWRPGIISGPLPGRSVEER